MDKLIAATEELLEHMELLSTLDSYMRGFDGLYRIDSQYIDAVRDALIGAKQ